MPYVLRQRSKILSCVLAGRAAERRHGGERIRESVWISSSERDHRWYFQSRHGTAKAKSKTEAMFFPKPRCDDGTTRRTFCALMGLFPTRICFSTSAFILSPVSIQLRRSRFASRRRRKLLDFGCPSKSTFRNKDTRTLAVSI